MIVKQGQGLFLVPYREPDSDWVRRMFENRDDVTPQAEEPSWPRLERWLRDYGLVIDEPTPTVEVAQPADAEPVQPAVVARRVWE